MDATFLCFAKLILADSFCAFLMAFVFSWRFCCLFFAASLSLFRCSAGLIRNSFFRKSFKVEFLSEIRRSPLNARSSSELSLNLTSTLAMIFPI